MHLSALHPPHQSLAVVLLVGLVAGWIASKGDIGVRWFARPRRCREFPISVYLAPNDMAAKLSAPFACRGDVVAIYPKRQPENAHCLLFNCLT
jgi:hypothetical protein